MDILDYNALIQCYGSPQTNPIYNCAYPTNQQTQGADILDDGPLPGAVDGADYNELLREWSVHAGQ